MTTVRDRLLARTARVGDCWIWRGRRHPVGYGQAAVDGESRYVHVVMWEIDNGPVPSGLELDHLCRNRACCNPAHLEPVTHAENMKRGAWAMRTHCQNGHELVGSNIKQIRGNTRDCRQCAIERNRAYRARKAS